MKKIISILFAAAMACSLCTFAFAATSDTLSESNLCVETGTWTEEDQNARPAPFMNTEPMYEDSNIVLDEQKNSAETAKLSSTFSESKLCVETGTWSDANQVDRLELPNTEPRYEDAIITSRALTINVNINSPLESTWRNAYSSSYYYEADRTIEKVDDYLYDEFGIDFYSKSQPHWSFSGSLNSERTYVNALNDAIDKYGTGSADLMIAFAGSIADTSQSTIFGVTYKGEPYCLLFNHNYYQNCKSTQHEVGHAYGLDECQSSVACVMRQGTDTSWNWFNHLCSSDYSSWSAAKRTYGG